MGTKKIVETTPVEWATGTFEVHSRTVFFMYDIKNMCIVCTFVNKKTDPRYEGLKEGQIKYLQDIIWLSSIHPVLSSIQQRVPGTLVPGISGLPSSIIWFAKLDELMAHGFNAILTKFGVKLEEPCLQKRTIISNARLMIEKKLMEFLQPLPIACFEDQALCAMLVVFIVSHNTKCAQN